MSTSYAVVGNVGESPLFEFLTLRPRTSAGHSDIWTLNRDEAVQSAKNHARKGRRVFVVAQVARVSPGEPDVLVMDGGADDGT